MINKKIILEFTFMALFILGLNTALFSQYPWPIEPKHQSHELTGTFCEFRDTGTSDHFHNGVDIPKADGSPVYAVANGIIKTIVSSGSNAYVRVGRYCYLHIKPNPNLSVGDAVVAEQTIVGTILAGQGHIHFIDGEYNSEINAIRMGGGLTPYNDPWAPKITYVKFFQDGTENQFTNGRISGKVDIVVKVEERNGAPTSPYSRLNNGTYKIGYKILSADRDTIKYSPPNNGLRFKFDSKPSNRYVHNVFFKRYSSTSSHVYIVTNGISYNGYWDANRLAVGEYQVMVFTEDTRQNTDTVYVAVEIVEEDLTAPQAPTLKYVRQMAGGFQIAWYPNQEDDIVGYRLYYSYDNVNWKLRYSESNLPRDSTTATFKTSLSSAIYFKVTAVDNAPTPNESRCSDVYGIKLNPGVSNNYVLVVDGFDRYGETSAWHEPSHSFGYTYGQAIAEGGVSFDFCSNDAVEDSIIELSRYSAVVWFVGDEAENDETFSVREQKIITSFLNQRGRLFISGANIAWDLDLDSDCYSTTAEDNNFLNHIIEADFAGKISSSVLIRGDNGLFNDLEFNLNPQLLPVDSVDVIEANLPGVGIPCLWYDSTQVAAILTVKGHPVNDDKLIYFAFPFEMIGSSSMRSEVMKRIIDYLLVINSVDVPEEGEPFAASLPREFMLEQNYPNPFTRSTVIRYHLPQAGTVSLKVYNLLGQPVRIIENKKLAPGIYEARWDGRNEQGVDVPNGIYLCVLKAGDVKFTRKLLLIKK